MNLLAAISSEIGASPLYKTECISLLFLNFFNKPWLAVKSYHSELLLGYSFIIKSVIYFITLPQIVSSIKLSPTNYLSFIKIRKSFSTYSNICILVC